MQYKNKQEFYNILPPKIFYFTAKKQSNTFYKFVLHKNNLNLFHNKIYTGNKHIK
jgi:hypothetical protein